ncbi:hypothetical protein RJ640_009143, partial [Escallonia rubra]
MASLDTDVTMVPAGEGAGSTGPSSSTASTSSSSKKPKRFEIKKWNAVSLWAWGTQFNPKPSILWWIIVRYVGITSWISVLSAKQTKLVRQVRSAQLLGESVTMHSTSTASADGSRLGKFDARQIQKLRRYMPCRP